VRGDSGSFEPYRAVLDSAPLAILIVHRVEGLIHANAPAHRLFTERGHDLEALSLDAVLTLLKPLEQGASEVDSPRRMIPFEALLAPATADVSRPAVPLEVTLIPQGEETVLIYLSDLTERRLLQDQYERQVRRLGALRAIDLAITGGPDLGVILDLILDHITRQLGVDAADVLLYDERVGRLEFGACRGFRTDALRHTSLPLGASYAGRAALERRVISVANLWEGGSLFLSSPLLGEEGFSAYAGIPLIAKGQVKGVLELFHRAALAQDDEWLDFANALGRQAAIAIENAALLGELQRSNLDLAHAYDTTLEGWSRTLDLRDRETEGHSQRVSDLSVRLSRDVGLRGNEIIHVRRGALLHDIGKMGIPDDILLKPGPLTDAEWTIMRRHPQYAYDVLAPIGYLRPAIDIPYYHHERWDGTGYPHALRGDRIPLTARIFALADVWDALTSERPYRPAWSPRRALEHIRSESGSHFDPALVERFCAILEANL
jgi:hypothetical protein